MSVKFAADADNLTYTVGDNTNSWTICGWFYLSTDTNTYRCLLQADPAGSILLTTGSDGTTLNVYNGSTEASGTNLSVNTWYHLALVRTAANLYGYVNGVLDITHTNPSTVKATQVLIGNDAWSEELDGRAACIKAWTAQLTAAEIAQEMHTIRPARLANLYAWWPLLPGATERLRDYSGNGRNFTAAGSLTDEDHPPVAWGARIHPIRWVTAAPTGITATGIDSITAIGSPTLSGAIVPTGIDSITAIGSETVSGALSLTGHENISAIGSPTLSGAIVPTGIASTEAVGSPALPGAITPDGFDSVTAIGTHTISGDITLSGIASTEAIGTHTLYGPIIPTGIASAEAIGSPTVTASVPGTITLDGIASGEAIGTLSIAHSIAPTGLENTSEFGLLLLTGFLPLTGIASITTCGSPILYEETSLTTIQAAWNDRTLPLFRFIIDGDLIVDEDRLLMYEEKQTGRLGRVEVVIILDNHDDYFNGLTQLRPRREIQVQIGAKVDANSYRARRHTLTMLDIAPVNFKNVTNALQIRCENYWDKFRRPTRENAAWTDGAIGDILDDIAAAAGITIQRDAAAFWAYTVDKWQTPAGLPPQPVIADLIGDGQRTHAIACARFDPEGIWQVEEIGLNPSTDVALSNTANQYDSDIGTHGDVGTRFQVTGSASQESASADDLETALDEQRIHIVNAYALPAAYVHARLVQEAIEQRERYTRGTLKMRPDARLQLWHVVTLSGVANIDPATQFRVTSIYFKYAPSVFDMQIGLRAVATDNNVTIIEPLPIVSPPDPGSGPGVQPPAPPVNPPGGTLKPPKTDSLVDDFDTVDAIDEWDFTNGTWSIETDLATTNLDIEHALAQTSATSVRSIAIRMGDYSSPNYFSGGIYLMAAGQAGFMAFAVDEENGYEIKIDSDANTIALIRWIHGNPYTLESASTTINTSIGYYVGIDRKGKDLRFYCKTIDQSNKPIFSASNLVDDEDDTTYLSGRIGFVSYGANVRFFSARAGIGPAHAHGEHAQTTKPHGHKHSTGSTWTAPTGSTKRDAWNTETCTLAELARVVKALIDDLSNDDLIEDS